MPHVFPSGQFPPEACGQVRPVGATLPTAARRALVKPRTATPVRRPGQHPRRETRHSRTGVLHQVNATGTPAWTYGVGS